VAVKGAPRGVTVKFLSPTPAMPTDDVSLAVEFYREVLGFEIVHAEGGFALLRRDGTTISLWGATDESWRESLDPERAICLGADSFIAGAASCSVQVEGVDELYAHCDQRGLVHPNGHIGNQPWGVREFGILDPDGNLVTFWQPQ
jgi:catechol 2,3-dioxygenase-like lactoylglutathione lyase family enzyme